MIAFVRDCTTALSIVLFFLERMNVYMKMCRTKNDLNLWVIQLETPQIELPHSTEVSDVQR